MAQIGTPLKFPELNISPEPEGGVELSKDMQQVLSTMTGFVQNKRVLLKASPSGVLEVSSARIRDIVHFTGSGANDEQVGEDIECTECLCMGHPSNAALVWVRADSIATVNNAWPLAAGEVFILSVDNLRHLNMLIVADTEQLIVAYTR